MKKQIKWIIIVLGFSAFSFWIGIQWERFWSGLDNLGKPHYKSLRVYFKEESDAIFIKSKAWGLLGNHTVTVISNNPELEFHPDSTFDYVFPGIDYLLYEKQADTLIVYHTQNSHIPDKFPSQINVKLVQLDIHKWRDIKAKAEDGIQIFK